MPVELQYLLFKAGEQGRAAGICSVIDGLFWSHLFAGLHCIAPEVGNISRQLEITVSLDNSRRPPEEDGKALISGVYPREDSFPQLGDKRGNVRGATIGHLVIAKGIKRA